MYINRLLLFLYFVIIKKNKKALVWSLLNFLLKISDISFALRHFGSTVSMQYNLKPIELVEI